MTKMENQPRKEDLFLTSRRPSYPNLTIKERNKCFKAAISVEQVTNFQCLDYQIINRAMKESFEARGNVPIEVDPKFFWRNEAEESENELPKTYMKNEPVEEEKEQNYN